MRRLNEIVERKRKLFKKDHQKQLREIRIDYCESSQDEMSCSCCPSSLVPFWSRRCPPKQPLQLHHHCCESSKDEMS